MKYRTVIELTCEASSREEASNIAGEYLKGELDFGVNMKCKSETVCVHKVAKYSVACILSVIVFSSLLFSGAMLGVDEKVQGPSRRGLYKTYTIMPALKTKHKADFKKEWEQKKEEAVLEFLKK